MAAPGTEGAETVDTVLSSEARACPSVESLGSSTVTAMRTPVLSLAFIVAMACGGGQNTREAAQSPETAPSAVPTPASADAGTLTPSPSGVAAAPASADATPSAKSVHTHDPGRGR